MMSKRYKGHLALTLAAYNAGMDVAATWWKRHAKDGLDVLAEDMTIQETRGYVKRVLRTFGIYRWLYADKPPELAVDLELPGT
jgi:soluble lytic murein transglycosylase